MKRHSVIGLCVECMRSTMFGAVKGWGTRDVRLRAVSFAESLG